MAQTKPKAGQFYGVSNNGTDGEFLQTDGAGGMAWAPTIVDPTITSIDYPGTQTAADPAGGESVIINGTLFASGITCTVGGTSAVTAFNSATQITITTPAKAAGPYTVAVLNPNGGTASQASFIQYSGVPVWSTAAGTLGNISEGGAASFQVTATEGSDTIEYAVTTGTLPTGLSLATATGAITGTAPTVSADTTTTFSITATDDENQTSASRSFSITVQNIAPSDHFNTVLYSGNGGTQSVTTGFAPDLTWIKVRSNADAHFLWNTISGANQLLMSNSNSAELTRTGVTAFNSNGFTLGNYPGVNTSSYTYVAWNFKAGGAAVANTDGIISTQVSANTTLGFSIITYDGATNATADTSNNSGTYWNVAHGLGATPDLVLVKKTNSAGSWYVGGAALSSTGVNGNHLVLDSTAAQVGEANILWGGSQTFNATTFGIGGWDVVNRNGDSYLAYCFTSKPGMSKVGSYTGTGSAGQYVVTGFEPAFVMVKTTSSTSNWFILDNKRNSNNPRNSYLMANSSAAQATAGTGINFLSNGFELKSTAFNDPADWIYIAFAADGSTATPSLANSFATEIYTGNGYPSSGNQSITTGFATDFSWIKNRNVGNTIVLFDSIRGPGRQLASSNTSAQAGFNGTTLTSFDSNGYSVGVEQGVNGGGNGIVSWNWKAGGTPSINTEGSITSIVSANQAAGFSIVKWSTSTTLATVGHGLSSAPELIIGKGINWSSSWPVYALPIGNTKKMSLNDTSIASTSTIWGNTTPTATTFNQDFTGTAGRTNIAYCFASISGYSKVGSYTGNGTLGHSIATGFAPGFVIIKMTSASASWYMFDNARTTGVYSDQLIANSNGAEATGTYVELTSTGFTLATTGSDLNNNNQTYIYLAIKEN